MAAETSDKSAHSPNFFGVVPNCYDSHVHWQFTGTYRRRLPEYTQQGDWITGFGWDEQELDIAKLDKQFGDTPVFFVRTDGHAAWVNKVALIRAGLWQKNPTAPFGGEIQLKEDGYPNGILLDHAMQIIEKLLPPRTQAQIRDDLLFAQADFHKAGFTHIRDLSGDEAQWQVTSQLIKENKIAMAVEQFFGSEDPNLFDRQLDLAIRLQREFTRAKAHGENNRWLVRPRGVKIYLDGALGSEGALLSCTYLSQPNTRGLQLIDKSTLRDFISRTWEAKLPIAVHAIGDAAAHLLAETATEIESKGLKGELHIEHAELMRVETISVLSKLNHVECYMQPCHWLTDKNWLDEKIGPLVKRVFRWREFEENNIQVWFGSDCPIEPSSLISNIAAVEDAAACADIPRPKLHPSHYQSHPDTQWVQDTKTTFVGDRVAHVDFAGHPVG